MAAERVEANAAAAERLKDPCSNPHLPDSRQPDPDHSLGARGVGSRLGDRTRSTASQRLAYERERTAGAAPGAPRARSPPRPWPQACRVWQARQVSFDLIVCADWSKSPANRAVWVAAPATKEVRRLEPTPGTPWTVARVLERTTRLVGTAGSALVSFDAPIGVPESYLDAARTDFGGPAAATFLDWLPLADASREFWDPVRSPAAWSVRRPFFVVPKGKGSLDGFNRAAAAAGIELRRDVEFASRGQIRFCLRIAWTGRSGCSGALARTPEGASPNRFHGLLSSGRSRSPRRPRARRPGRRRELSASAYGTALSAELPAKPRVLSKTKQRTRTAEVINLQTSPWIAEFGVSLNGLSAAVASEDDFDALNDRGSAAQADACGPAAHSLDTRLR